MININVFLPLQVSKTKILVLQILTKKVKMSLWHSAQWDAPPF